MELLRFHPVLSRFSYEGLRDLLYYTNLIVLPKDKVLYSEGQLDPHRCVYLVVSGQLVLHQKDLGAYALISIQQTLGEEALSRFQSWVYGINGDEKPTSRKLEKAKIIQHSKREEAYSTEDTYLLELFEAQLKRLKDYYLNVKNKKDWLILENLFKHNFEQKRTWIQ